MKKNEAVTYGDCHLPTNVSQMAVAGRIFFYAYNTIILRTVVVPMRTR